MSFCPNCGFHIPQDASYHFCPKCGIKLSLPADPSPPRDEPPIGSFSETLPGGNLDQPTIIKKKILIVEDDLFIRELYQKQLSMAGYEVDTAVDGLEGREKILGSQHNLILLDIMLPKMNGLDLLKNLKDDPTVKETPVIILSNLGQDSVVEKGLSLGADNYLVKADTTPMEMLKLIRERIGA